MKIKKGNVTLDVSEKAFRVVYASLGYKEVKDAKSRTKASDEDAS